MPVTDDLLDRMVRAIVDEGDPEQVILFGSRGRGDHRADSDIDLVVIEAEPFGPRRSRHQELVRLYGAVAGFPAHVQQAAEKAFKAWLALLGETYPLTHNLQALLNLLAARGADTEPFRELARYMPYAVEFRYEGVAADAERIPRENATAIGRAYNRGDCRQEHAARNPRMEREVSDDSLMSDRSVGRCRAGGLAAGRCCRPGRPAHAVG